MNISIVVGHAWHAPQLVEGLEALGHVVKVVSTDKQLATTRIRMRTLLRICDRVSFLRLFGNRLFSTIASRKVGGADLIIIWSSFGGSFRRFKGRIPIILVRGNNHILRQLDMIRPSLIDSMVAKYLELKDYRLADVVTVPTPEIADTTLWDQINVKVNPYGFPIVDQRNLISSRSKDSRLKIFFLGEFSLRKGNDRMKRLLSNPLPDVEFHLIGKVHGKDLPLPSWWTIHGKIESCGVQDLIRELDALVLFSREEGMARAGLESIANGKPIIVTPETGLSIWVKLGCGVLLPSEPDLNDLRSALKTIYDSYELYANTCLSVSKSWTWTDHAQQLLSQLE